MNRLGIIVRRHYQTAFCLYKNKNFKKMPKMMQKIIDKGARKKKKWFDSPTEYGLGLGLSKGPSENKQRRAQYVAPILYDYITQIVNSGELNPGITLKTVEINKVKVFPDFSVMHVYWKGSGTERDDQIQKLLVENAAKLRSILCSYRVMGSIPEIVFIKDLSEVKYLEVMKLLEQADMGEDFEPTELGSDLLTSPTLVVDEHMKSRLQEIESVGLDFTKTDSNVTYMGINQSDMKFAYKTKQSIPRELPSVPTASKMEAETSYISKDILDSPKPLDISFRNDLYGIQHDMIMKKLILSKQKVCKNDIEMDFMKGISNFSVGDLSGTKKQSVNIGKYLRARQKKEKNKLSEVYTFHDFQQDILEEKSGYQLAYYDDNEKDDEDNVFDTIDELKDMSDEHDESTYSDENEYLSDDNYDTYDELEDMSDEATDYDDENEYFSDNYDTYDELEERSDDYDDNYDTYDELEERSDDYDDEYHSDDDYYSGDDNYDTYDELEERSDDYDDEYYSDDDYYSGDDNYDTHDELEERSDDYDDEYYSSDDDYETYDELEDRSDESSDYDEYYSDDDSYDSYDEFKDRIDELSDYVEDENISDNNSDRYDELEDMSCEHKGDDYTDIDKNNSSQTDEEFLRAFDELRKSGYKIKSDSDVRDRGESNDRNNTENEFLRAFNELKERARIKKSDSNARSRGESNDRNNALYSTNNDDPVFTDEPVSTSNGYKSDVETDSSDIDINKNEKSSDHKK